MKGLISLTAFALAVVAVTAGCGSGKNAVQLNVNTQSTNGKALVFTALTDAKFA